MKDGLTRQSEGLGERLLRAEHSLPETTLAMQRSNGCAAPEERPAGLVMNSVQDFAETAA
jgi:hypothetical protein